MLPVSGFRRSVLNLKKLLDRKNSSFWTVPRTLSFFSKQTKAFV